MWALRRQNGRLLGEFVTPGSIVHICSIDGLVKLVVCHYLPYAGFSEGQLVLRQYALLSFLSYLISCFSFYLILLYRIYLIRSRDLFVKVRVMWYDVTGTLVPIKGPGFHRIPGHSMGFYFLPCDVIPLCLFGHFPVVYIGLLYRVYNPRIDLV